MVILPKDPPTSEGAVLVLEGTHQSLRTHTRELSLGRPQVPPCFGKSCHLSITKYHTEYHTSQNQHNIRKMPTGMAPSHTWLSGTVLLGGFYDFRLAGSPSRRLAPLRLRVSLGRYPHTSVRARVDAFRPLSRARTFCRRACPMCGTRASCVAATP